MSRIWGAKLIGLILPDDDALNDEGCNKRSAIRGTSPHIIENRTDMRLSGRTPHPRGSPETLQETVHIQIALTQRK